ncbi:hypothetical protein FHG87_004329 [Trinorchestia longiramus]|nr:hypothetical protein FHG87_004329 [Trinorchestia longiramus]
MPALRSAEETRRPGLDYESVGLDHESVGLDHESVGLDHESVGLDHESVGLDHESVGLDRESVRIDHEFAGLDRESAGLDHKSTGLDHEFAGLDHEFAGLAHKWSTLATWDHKFSVYSSGSWRHHQRVTPSASLRHPNLAPLLHWVHQHLTPSSSPSPRLNTARFVSTSLRPAHPSVLPSMSRFREQCSSKCSVPPPWGVEELQGSGRRVRLEWGAYITV